MKRSPVAFALVAALGSAATLPSAPVLAQDGASMTVMPIRTGSSSIGGAFGVRLSVYDARSFELSWNRIPNAATYRVQVGSRTVQENGAISRFVGNADLSGGFDYTLTALDRSGTALAVQRFRVQPAGGTQLVAAGGGTSAPTAPSTPAMPTTPANPATPGAPTTPPAAGTSPPTNLRVQVYSSTAAELFWQPGTFVDRNEIRRDGVLVATLGGGATRSYFDAARQPGRSYAYQVTAFNGAGPASATVGGTGSTPATPANPATPTTPANPANPMAPVAPPAAGGPIRTGASTVAGDIPVRLAVYDARSFELFWERVPGAATYRLSRDGQVVQESNGLSRFMTGVNGSASFAYTLVALDRSGTALRSTRFTVSPSAGTQLALGGSGTAPTSPANPTVPTAPPAVNNGPIRTGQTSLAGNIAVRLSVYDAKAYELFWERVPSAVRYRLSRGGSVVQESDAISYFVGNADSTQRFDYTLVALDRSGNAVRTARFTVAPRGTPQLAAAGGGASTPATPTPPSGTGDLPADIALRLRTLFELVNGDAIETALRVQARLRQLAAGGELSLVSTTPDPDIFRDRNVYACPNGGTFSLLVRSLSGSGTLNLLDATNCGFGPVTVTGRFSDEFFVGRGLQLATSTTTIDGYTLSDSRDGSTTSLSTIAVSGSEGVPPLASIVRPVQWSGQGVSVDRPVRPYSSSPFQTRLTATAEEGFELTARSEVLVLPGGPRPATNLGSGPVVFGPGETNPRTGRLTTFINGNGGRGMEVIEADNGDPATFQYILGGGAQTYTVPWSTDFSFSPIDPDPAKLGF